jgi:hypothetical protein
MTDDNLTAGMCIVMSTFTPNTVELHCYTGVRRETADLWEQQPALLVGISHEMMFNVCIFVKTNLI